MSNPSMAGAQLSYSLLADDVRLEVGNKLSIMGLFQNIYLPSLPAPMLRFVIINHWIGGGDHFTQIKILSPQHGRIIASTEPSRFSLSPSGFADNITAFANVLFEEEGPHFIQIFLDDQLVHESCLHARKWSPLG
jgi:hypothetical protein